MKIVCDACSAKYSIADDKVKGKVFKIRCKKCSNIIVVRGSGPGAAVGGDEAPAPQFDQKETRVYDYGTDGDAGGAVGGDEAVWHIVVDQEQVGPVTVAEVQRRFGAGEIDADTFIWREGFADWQPLAQVEAFAALASGGAAHAAALAPAAGGMDDGLFGGAAPDEGGTVRSDPNDLFAAAAAAPAARGGDEDDDNGDLFGAKRGTGGGQRRSAEMAAQGGAAADKKLRGERNENSVLFSLGNLAALASDAPRASAGPSSAPAAAASGGGGGPGAAQQGGGEGSGLIDIRSMASAYLGADKGGAGGARIKPQVGSIDDLPVFSSATFSEPVVIMPTGRAGGGDKKLLYVLIGVVGLLALVAILLVVMVLSGGKKDGGAGAGSQVAQNNPPAGGGTNTPAPSGSDQGGGAASGAAAGTGSAAAASGGGGSAAASGSAAAAPAGSGSAVAGGGSASGSATAPAGSGSSSGAAAGSDNTVAANTPPHGGTKPPKHDNKNPPRVADNSTPNGGHKDTHTVTPPAGGDAPVPKGKCMDDVGCMLADHPPACCAQYKDKGGGGGGGGGTKPNPAVVDTSLPEELDRSAVSDGVGKVRGRINACGDKSSAKGEVKVSVKVSPGGSVSSVTVKNTPDAGLGSCVAGAMQGAHFAKTQKGGAFSYPFIFR